MLNSLASGRRLMLRIVAWQAVVALLAGALFLLQEPRAALAAALCGLLATLGTLLLGWRAFNGVRGSGLALTGLVAGLALKWVVIVGGLVLVIGVYRLPPLPALAGLVAAYAVNLLAFRFKG